MGNNLKFKVKILSYITFFAILFYLSLNAQTFKAAIKGHVLDNEGKPLPGVTVTINSPNDRNRRMAADFDLEPEARWMSRSCENRRRR